MSSPFLDQLSYGGDYNPEQWSREVWLEDVKLMKEANVNLVTLGVFAWANIEVADGKYEFGWLDEIFDLLHENGIGVDLATATASPPAWLTRKWPEVLPVTSQGVRHSHGGRQAYCVSSPIYKQKAADLAGRLADRYSKHPALKMWHVNNEYGCHNPLCFCDQSEIAWRSWLKLRYSNLDELNRAWGTNFWSQKYHDWEEINVPAETPAGTYPNPSMFLDFRRFSHYQILDLYRAEKDQIRKFDSSTPITTNFMSMKHSGNLNYWDWANEVDFVATDHYLNAEDPKNYIDLAFQADLTRGFAQGKPWLLMEHSTSAVNWQQRNIAKSHGEMIANSMSHIARGSNGAMFFQWRQSISGSEKFHSAMFPHAGRKSRIWRSVVELGKQIHDLGNLSKTQTQRAQVAMIFDYESWWALSQMNLPSTSISYPELAHDWYRALWELGVRVDFVSPNSLLEDLNAYELVLAPMQYLMSDSQEHVLSNYVANGKNLISSYFTGISNEDDSIKTGGYGGKLATDVIGIHVEEFAPARSNEFVELSNGYKATEWSQFAQATTANVLAKFSSGEASGSAAIVRSRAGNAWYIGTRLDDDSCKHFFDSVVGELRLAREGGDGVEVVRRGQTKFLINHNTNEVSWEK